MSQHKYSDTNTFAFLDLKKYAKQQIDFILSFCVRCVAQEGCTSKRGFENHLEKIDTLTDNREDKETLLDMILDGQREIMIQLYHGFLQRIDRGAETKDFYETEVKWFLQKYKIEH